MLDSLVAHLKLRNSRRPKLKRISVYLIFFFFKKKKKFVVMKGQLTLKTVKD